MDQSIYAPSRPAPQIFILAPASSALLENAPPIPGNQPYWKEYPLKVWCQILATPEDLGPNSGHPQKSKTKIWLHPKIWCRILDHKIALFVSTTFFNIPFIVNPTD